MSDEQNTEHSGYDPEKLRATSLRLHEVERDLAKHKAVVEDLADPDLEEAFLAYRDRVHGFRRWLYPKLEDAGIV